MNEAAVLPLLQLPHPCLLAVLQCCADEPRSLFSAARAHSRLRQAAAMALSSISTALKHQQQLDSVLLCLSGHAAVAQLQLEGPSAESLPERLPLNQIPAGLKLGSLALRNLQLQLGPGGAFTGVLQPGMPLKQLRLADCELHGAPHSLRRVLPRLTELQHLSISNLRVPRGCCRLAVVSVQQLGQLQQLTSLEVVRVLLSTADPQPLGLLTGLRDLRWGPSVSPFQRRFDAFNDYTFRASALRGLQQLTRLVLGQPPPQRMFQRRPPLPFLEPAVLAGKTQLKHLSLTCEVAEAAGAAELLSHLQHLTDLTYLFMHDTLSFPGPSAVAYSALTASSHLQHLEVVGMSPTDVWQHILPAGRQLPWLRVLEVSLASYDADAADDSSDEGSGMTWQVEDLARVASCCPGLQELCTTGEYTAELLAPLIALTGLSKLSVGIVDDEGLGAAAQPTGLQDLTLWCGKAAGGFSALPLTQLTQLTRLDATLDFGDSSSGYCCLTTGALPVWQQLLQSCNQQGAFEEAQAVRSAVADAAV